MKNKIIILAVLFLGLTTIFTACKKKEETPAAKTTGGLIIKVKVRNSANFVPDVDVYLATSEANLENEIYIQEKITDANGQANFGQLNAGTYYYYGENDESSGDGLVQIQAGKDSDVTLEISGK